MSKMYKLLVNQKKLLQDMKDLLSFVNNIWEQH